MKPFWGIDTSENKKNQTRNGREFASASVSAVQTRALEQAADNAVKMDNQSKLPLPLRIIHTGAGMLALLMFVSLLRAFSEVSIAEAYRNAPGIFWVAGGSALVWLILTPISRVRRKKVLDSEENAYAVSRLDSVVDNIHTELGVPQDAKDVDILAFAYKLKKGEPAPIARGMDTAAYSHVEFKLFVQDGKLCLADWEEQVCLPPGEAPGHPPGEQAHLRQSVEQGPGSYGRGLQAL